MKKQQSKSVGLEVHVNNSGDAKKDRASLESALREFKKRIKPMMVDKQIILRLGRLCSEIDRQYEFNNNG